MKKSLVLLTLPVLALTSCYGIKKVSFDEFKSSVKEATAETPKVKEVKISGKYDGNKLSTKITLPDSFWSSVDLALDDNYSANEKKAFAIADTYKTPSGYAVSEDKEVVYYTGLGFKVVDGRTTIEWNSKGLLSSYEADATKLNFYWVKA